MPRARPTAQAVMADTPEELETLLRDLPAPTPIASGEPSSEPPAEPPPPQPEPDGDDENEGDEDEPEDEPDEPETDAPVTTQSRFVSRIHVVDAWRYPGSLRDRPAFVDPSWTAWADIDEVNKLPAGPALRVPVPSHPEGKIARVGDYVVLQTITRSGRRVPSDPVIDVWTGADFEKLFMSRAA